MSYFPLLVVVVLVVFVVLVDVIEPCSSTMSVWSYVLLYCRCFVIREDSSLRNKCVQCIVLVIVVVL